LSPAAAWDRSLGRRAATIGAVAIAVTLLVVAATDAGGPWSLRLGMTAALAPLCGALGTLAAARIAAGRGELVALAAVGADPRRAVLGAVLGGIGVGLLGPLAAGLGLADLDALFPRPGARAWVTDAAGLHETTLGLHIGLHGELALEAPRAMISGLPAGAMAFALAALAATALAGPAWLAAPMGSPARRAGVGGAAAAMAIVAFQAVAAGRAPAFVLVAAPLVLLADACLP